MSQLTGLMHWRSFEPLTNTMGSSARTSPRVQFVAQLTRFRMFRQNEVAELLLQTGWQTQVIPKSRYCKRGRASWSVKANADPEKYIFDIMSDDDFDDSWCEAHQEFREEQQATRQRQAVLEQKLEQIMGALQQLTVQQQQQQHQQAAPSSPMVGGAEAANGVSS